MIGMLLNPMLKFVKVELKEKDNKKIVKNTGIQIWRVLNAADISLFFQALKPKPATRQTIAAPADSGLKKVARASTTEALSKKNTIGTWPIKKIEIENKAT